MKRLYDILSELNEAIEYEELTDHVFTKNYTRLLRERRVIARTIRRIEKIEKKTLKHGANVSL